MISETERSHFFGLHTCLLPTPYFLLPSGSLYAGSHSLAYEGDSHLKGDCHDLLKSRHKEAPAYALYFLLVYSDGVCFFPCHLLKSRHIPRPSGQV
jgi:hypothetical protein